MRLLTASALVALTIITATAGGQPQPGGPKKGGDDKKLFGEKADKKPADPTDTAIATALANDPDVRMAKAKIQLAEAELAKARQAVTLKVVALKGKIDLLKTEVANLQESVAVLNQAFKQGAAPQSLLIPERAKLEAAMAALASAETEWKLLTAPGAGGPVGDLLIEPNDAVPLALRYLGAHTANDPAAARLAQFLAVMGAAREREAVKGPIPDRIRAALDKPVKLGPKGEKVTFEKALAVFKKEAGLDVPVRGAYPMRFSYDPKNPNEPQAHPIEIVSEGEELPVGAWFQLFEDSAGPVNRRNGEPTRFRFYVREYGLLASSAAAAPPDAPALTEFWKQKLPAQGPKDEPAPKM
jgi:hypothetical protein